MYVKSQNLIGSSEVLYGLIDTGTSLLLVTTGDTTI